MKMLYQLNQYEMSTATNWIGAMVEECPHMIMDTAEAERLITILMADTTDCSDKAIQICKDFIKSVEYQRPVK